MTAWTLCSEQDVRDIQTVPDTIPETWSEIVEGMIREYMGLSRLGLPSASFTEYRSGDGSYLMRVRKAPIIDITSLTVSDVAVSSANIYVGKYFIELKNGLVFTNGVRNVALTYTAGEGDITPDVRLAAATMVVAFNNFYGRSGSDASLKWSTMMDDGRDHTRGGEAGPSKRVGFSHHLDSIMKGIIKNRNIKVN